MRIIRQRTRAQAVVEFALAATLIFLLLSAAVDLGLIFFKHQGLYNASLEGASYGSRFVKTVDAAGGLNNMSKEERTRLGCYNNSNVQAICIDDDAVKTRLTNEAGAGGGINAVNLKDLNGDGIEDDKAVRDEYITVVTVSREEPDGVPKLPKDACPDLTNPPGTNIPYCYLYVQVKSNYNMFFALAPAFGDQVEVSAHTLFPVRINVPSAPGEVGTETLPTASPTSTNTATATSTDTATATASNTPGLGGDNPTSTPTNTRRPGEPDASNTPTDAADSPQTPTSTSPGGPPAPTNTRTATKTHTPGPSPTRRPTSDKTDTSKPTKTRTSVSNKPTLTRTRKPTSRPKPQVTDTSQGT